MESKSVDDHGSLSTHPNASLGSMALVLNVCDGRFTEPLYQHVFDFLQDAVYLCLKRTLQRAAKIAGFLVRGDDTLLKRQIDVSK